MGGCAVLTVSNSDATGSVTAGSLGDTVSVTCADGYSGSGVATCNADSGATTASWSAPSCVASSCGALIIANSDAEGSDTGVTGDAVEVMCDIGYGGGSTMFSQCEGDVGSTSASWDYDTAFCFAASCGSLTVQFSDADGSTTGLPGDSASVTCD